MVLKSLQYLISESKWKEYIEGKRNDYFDAVAIPTDAAPTWMKPATEGDVDRMGTSLLQTPARPRRDFVLMLDREKKTQNTRAGSP